MMEPGFPLVTIALKTFLDAAPEASAMDVAKAREIFLDFLAKKEDSHSCKAKIAKLVPNATPIERMEEILNAELVPIPDYIREADDFDEKGRRRKTRPWTGPEDNRLLMAVYKYGLDSWSKVAQYVGFGRTRSQCSQRWIRGIDPRVSRSNWTAEEEEKLVSLVKIYGLRSWMKIASLLGDRSDVQCRYKYHIISRDRNISNDIREVQAQIAEEKQIGLSELTFKQVDSLAIPIESNSSIFGSSAIFDSSLWSL